VTTGESAGKAKILRSVPFAKTIDIFEYCTDELKAKLMAGRELETKVRESQDNKALAGEEEKKEEDVEMKDESSGAAAASKNLVGDRAKAAFV